MDITSYATLSELKQYLGISDTTNDNILAEMLNSSYLLLNHLIGVDTLNLTTGVEYIERNKLYTNGLQDWFYLTNKPVISIDKIGGETYSGVKGTDYMVIYDRKILFNKIDFLDKVKFGLLEVEYTWGYNREKEISGKVIDTLPDDIKLMQMMLVGGMRNTKGMEGVSSYKIGDEQITFGPHNGQSADEIYFSFKMLLNRYKSFNLP